MLHDSAAAQGTSHQARVWDPNKKREKMAKKN